MNYNVTVNGKVYSVTVEKTGVAAPAAAAPVMAAPVAAPAPAAQSNNQQLVAAIAAAIAEDMGEDVDHIKILSIRRV